MLAALYRTSALAAEPTSPVPAPSTRAEQREEWSESVATERTTQAPAAVDRVLQLDVVDSAFGAAQGSLYVGFQGLIESNSTEEPQGGLLVGGAPLSVLSLQALLGRDGDGRFSPTVTAHLCAWGGADTGHALGVLGRYKAEGFDELGGELEFGLTGAMVTGRAHLDLNLIGGIGVEEEEEGEIDIEAKARVGYDLASMLRIGALARGRQRLRGEVPLNGRRNWDVLAGAEVLYWTGPVVLAVSGGPSTVRSQTVGGYVMLTLAGTASLL